MNHIDAIIDSSFKARFKPSIKTFNFIAGYTDTFEEVKYACNFLRKQGLKHSKLMYHTLMSLVENYDDASYIIAEMKKNKIKRDFETYMNYVDTACNDLQARNAIKEMVNENIEIKPVIYNILIKKQDSYFSSRKVLTEMKEKVMNPTYITYHLLLLMAQSEEEANDALYEMRTGKSKFDSELYYSLQSLNRGVRANLIREGMRKSYTSLSPKILDSIARGNASPKRKMINSYKFERDYVLVCYIKEFYKNTCQICGTKLDLGEHEYYCEVHHIQPLSQDGPDILENMIVLCPNHHTLFDKGAITIDLRNKIVVHINKFNQINGAKILINHKIRDEYIEYHNANILRKLNVNMQVD